MNAAYWIKNLNLEPHSEGGFFRESYRASEELDERQLPKRFFGSRSFSTAIYFLLRTGEFSTLHRIQSDEVWHFYAGDTLTVYAFHPDGRLESIRLGKHTQEGEVFQAVVPFGAWFGARVEAPGTYSLVGCTVAPGFDFRDFELGPRAELLKKYPQHRDVITGLTHA